METVYKVTCPMDSNPGETIEVSLWKNDFETPMVIITVGENVLLLPIQYLDVLLDCLKAIKCYYELNK